MSLITQMGKMKGRKLLIHSIWTRFSRFYEDLIKLQIKFTLLSVGLIQFSQLSHRI